MPATAIRPSCPHGLPLSCFTTHGCTDVVLGEPLCPACFAYDDVVLWNAALGRLWDRPVAHDLRQTGATLAAATGASTRELMLRLGHSSPAAALRYQHATADRDAAIARVLSALAEAAPPLPQNTDDDSGLDSTPNHPCNPNFGSPRPAPLG